MAPAGAAVALCGLIAVGCGPRARAEDALTPPPAANPAAARVPVSKTITLKITGADLYNVVNILQGKTKMDVAIVEGDHPYNKVRVYLENVTPETALRNIAASAGATVSINPDGVYVLRPAPSLSDSVAATQNATYVQPAPEAQARPRYKPGDIRPHKLYLKNISPDDVLKKFGWGDVTPQEDAYQSYMRTHPTMNVTSTGGGVTALPQGGLLNPTAPYQINAPTAQQPVVPAGRGDTGLNQANDTPNSAGRAADSNGNGQAQQFPGGGGFGGGGFGGGGFPGGGGGIGGQFGQQQTLLPEGVDRVYAIEGDNSLLVFSTVDGFNLVKEIVKNLDIAPRQVQIKMEFVTAAVHDVDLFGINFSLIPSPSLQGAFSPASSTGAATSLTPSPPNTYLQFAYGNVAAQLYALLYKQRGKIVNAPLITTTNNTPAFIAFNSQIPFQTSNQTIIPNGGAVTTTTQNFQNILSTLQVQPRINGDDTVTLTLTPQISQPSGPATAGGPAPVSTQFLLATRTVRSGETMVVGGLVTKTDTFIESRIPILGDLPIIGQFFRSRNKDVNDSELLIFVTPTIIDENAQNTGITAEPQGAVGVNAAPGPQPNPGGQVTP